MLSLNYMRLFTANNNLKGNDYIHVSCEKEDNFDDLKTFVINFLTTANWCVSAVRSVI